MVSDKVGFPPGFNPRLLSLSGIPAWGVNLRRGRKSVRCTVLFGHDISVSILPLVREVRLFFSRAEFLNCSQLSRILDMIVIITYQVESRQ